VFERNSPVVDLENRQARVLRQLFLLIFWRVRMLKWKEQKTF